MDITAVLNELCAERDRLDKAIAAMEGITPTEAARPAAITPSGRRMSAAARARISAAQRARWARQRSKKAAPATTPRSRSRMSPAARKRLSDLLKKRWASGKMGKQRRAKAA